MSDTVVISGAAMVPIGSAPAASLVSVPEVADVAIADSGTGAQLLIHNTTAAPLRIAVEGVGDITTPAAVTTAVAMPVEPDEARLHLQALSTTRSQVVMVIVTVEASDDGPIAVGQAIGARTC